MVSFLLASLIGVSCHFGDYCDKQDTYAMLFDEALNNCPNTRGKEESRIDIVNLLISIESEYDLPCSMRGMLLAAACYESGYNPNALGDRKFSKKNRPLAVGILQMWPWWEKQKYGYGINRRDPEQAARAWMDHIISKIPKAKKICRFKSEHRLWVAAWVHAIRKPKKGGRCFERPKHLRLLKKWHRNIKRHCEILGC